MKRLLLAMLRLFDKSAYICVECGKLKRGWCIKVSSIGKTCSRDCHHRWFNEGFA